MKLNLGCGDKILPGYVNVDVAESRLDRKPDVVCDLHVLTPFEDGVADEILSVHVIEHFWRWEVVDVLKEWLRVLKPAGLMVIECPISRPRAGNSSPIRCDVAPPGRMASAPCGCFTAILPGAIRSWCIAGDTRPPALRRSCLRLAS